METWTGDRDRRHTASGLVSSQPEGLRFLCISDYRGAVLFDGWIYFGESSRIPITDENSPAVRTINAVYPPGLSNTSNVPTSWTIYYLLLQHGYTSEQAFTLLDQASMDSIRNDIPLSLKIAGD